MTTESQPLPTYAEQADAKRAALMAELDDGARQTMGEMFARLMASDFGANAINVGDMAPDSEGVRVKPARFYSDPLGKLLKFA